MLLGGDFFVVESEYWFIYIDEFSDLRYDDICDCVVQSYKK